MKIKSKLSLVLATGLIALATAGSALAGGAWSNYNLTVPKFGGSVTTNNVFKSTFSTFGRIDSQSVGGGYTVYVRQELQNNTALSDYYPIVTGTRINIPNWAPNKNNVHDRLKSNWTTPVNVVAFGRWSPDDPAW